MRTSVATLVERDAPVALEIGGHPSIPVREKGPFWVVFPWSQLDDLDEPIADCLSIWQLQTVDVC